MDTANQIREIMRVRANKRSAALLARFFKTGPGQYGAGDAFLGLNMPTQRAIARQYRDLPIKEIEKLLPSKFHEERMVALLIIVDQFERANDENGCARLYKVYLKNIKWINSWDLVDVTTPKVVGAYLSSHSRSVLYTLACSKNIWERRIAVLATFWFIRDRDYKDALKIAELLLGDEHDLIHKAAGWMLREIGKRDVKVLRKFLDTHAAKMPRTMLRYAIEHFSPSVRGKYLGK